MKNRKLRMNKVILLAIGSLLVFILILVPLVNKGYIELVKTMVRRTTTTSINELTVSKGQFLDERIRSELLSLDSLALSISQEGDVFSKRNLVTEYAELHGASNMWIVDIHGNKWSEKAAHGEEASLEKNDFFSPALRGETGMSDVYYGAMGKRHVLIQTPIYLNGNIEGGLYESYAVELLQNTYGNSTYNDAGYSYVLAKDGDIVLSPVRFNTLQIYGNFRQVLERGGNNQQTIDQFMYALKNNSSGSATFDFEGDTQFLSFVPLEAHTGWYIVTVLPLSIVERDGILIVDMTVRMGVLIIMIAVAAVLLAMGAVYSHNRKRREYDQYIQNINQAISQNIDTVIFFVDKKTSRVEYAFENSQDVLGIPAQAFLKQDGQPAGAFQKALQKLLLEERPLEKCQWELAFFNDALNRQIWLKLTALPVKLANAPKFIFAATDITRDHQILEDLSAAVSAAEQANAAKSSFLSNMSHDIRTPMNAIVGMTKLAKIYITDREKVEDCLHKIEISSKHLLGLINDVLDMSKIESGKMTLSTEGFSLPELIESDLSIIQPQCRSKNQTFNVETKNIRHELLEGDPLRLNQVFLNLFSNAVKFTPEHGSIKFSIEELLQRHPGCASYCFRVSDTGIGVSAEFLPVIFNAFERASTNVVGKTEGTGLGLAISKNIIEAMGGQISVTSTEGKGTTFTVELEFKLQPGMNDEIEEDRRLRGLHTLLVSNHQEDLELLADYLTGFGMILDTAGGDEAFTLYEKKKPFEFVILDCKRSGIDGMETARQIRSLSAAETKIVMIADCDTFAVDFNDENQLIDALLQTPVFKSTLFNGLLKLFSAGLDDAGETAQTESLHGKRFLLVEDNELNREIAVQLFELSGAQMETAENGKEGAAAFETSACGYYDAIFMDIQMPVMNGYESARRIRSSNHSQAESIPIIAMSANVFAEDVRASYEAGMNAHVGKPIDMEEICRILIRLAK